MASEPTYSFADESGNPPRTDYQDHVRTYEAFVSLTKWGIGTVVVILIAMAVFLL
ncbi:aa3-type cytochrome c oxidase subunit IV [Acuticoccus sp. I52.16.1]|uniref:aa3-type cytochrome c oxidase subunit IV n=1 Tax=Acuticoccus sp. I52.16.1 TaxID=2928472 RepID=UPI001FD184D5|nr:aa3-type cytochrome c oxidase subunit IV [Acuticoccus sp. I52.16.1]UOM33798.1 aa3-type cytochrome c oxidase subunit IV [Acuticoccus sp. I52.16.1]